jgi:hypothetical protein
MARKLRTAKGRTEYARRKAIVEPIFGQLKEATSFRCLSLRGKSEVTAGSHLVCAAHSLAKLFRSGRAHRAITGRTGNGAASRALGWA